MLEATKNNSALIQRERSIYLAPRNTDAANNTATSSSSNLFDASKFDGPNKKGTAKSDVNAATISSSRSINRKSTIVARLTMGITWQQTHASIDKAPYQSH